MTNTLRSLLTYIMNNYDTSKPFAGSDVAYAVRHGMENISNIAAIESNGFSFYGSPGKGNWAEVPWIGLFDTNHFKASAQVGIYLVYLFSTDHKTVYLSLDQAWTPFKNRFGTKQGKIQLTNSTNSIRKIINIDNYVDNPVYDISLDNSSDSGTDNPKGYELSNIVAIKYNLDNMPDEKTLLNDLSSMKSLLINTIDQLDIYVSDKETTYTVDESKNAGNPIVIPSDIKYTSAEVAPHTAPHKTTFNPSTTVRKDYEKEYKNSKNNGARGEQIVMKLEKEKLKNYGKPELAKKVEHVSVTQGDGAGFDIKSFDEKGNEIYIEVKSTTSPDRKATFNISTNEINASEHYGNSYYLYRLYDISNIHEHPKYYKLQGNLKDALHLYATSFIASPK